MLKHKAASVAIWVACGILGAVFADDQPCSISVGKTASASDSVEFTLNISDVACQFQVAVRDSLQEATDCGQDEENGQTATCKIGNLEAGTLYHLNVMSKSDGNQRNISLPTRPSPVRAVQVFRDTGSLNVSWLPGRGRREQFGILLRDSKDLDASWNTTVDNATTSYAMDGLIPGRLYNISIITESAGLQDSVSVQARTGSWVNALLYLFPAV